MTERRKEKREFSVQLARVRRTPETEHLGIADVVGAIHGFTTPSHTGIVTDVECSDDHALCLYVENGDLPEGRTGNEYWLPPGLLEDAGTKSVTMWCEESATQEPPGHVALQQLTIDASGIARFGTEPYSGVAFDEIGERRIESTYQDGEKHGVEREYLTRIKGALVAERHYSSGREVGKPRFWDDDGNLVDTRDTGLLARIKSRLKGNRK